MRILFVKSSSLGDILHAFDAAAFLKQRIPDLQLDWVVEEPFADMVRAHPFVRQVLPIASKRWRRGGKEFSRKREIAAFIKTLRATRYDVVFDLQGNCKSGLVTLLTKARAKVGFGRRSVPELPNLLVTSRRFNPPPGKNVREDLLFLVQSYFDDFVPVVSTGVALRVTEEQEERVDALMSCAEIAGGIPTVVCPGSAWPNKQLSEETLGAFLRGIAARWDLRFLWVYGNAQEEALVEGLRASFPNSVKVPRLSLPGLQRLMGQSHLVIAMDSLPLHLAGTAGTASFSFFGPSLADKYKPSGLQHGHIQGPCPYGKTFVKRCSILRTCPTGACLKDLQADALVKAFNSWWQQQKLRFSDDPSTAYNEIPVIENGRLPRSNG